MINTNNSFKAQEINCKRFELKRRQFHFMLDNLTDLVLELVIAVYLKVVLFPSDKISPVTSIATTVFTLYHATAKNIIEPELHNYRCYVIALQMDQCIQEWIK